MPEARIKAGIWVSMALRMGNANGRYGAVLRKGDPDSGGILVVLHGRAGLSVLSQMRTADGEPAWMRATGPAPVDQATADAYVARQLRTWYGSWTSSKEDAAFDDARIHELHDLLQARMPVQGPARVVHGDYGVHNCMVGQDGNLTAVLDWEIATLGDPLADFAYALNGWGDPGDGEGSVIAGGATTAPGFEDREVLAERYATATGADLTQLDYYQAFNYFKSACILHGVYARYQAGKKSSEGVDIPQLFDRMRRSIGFAERAAGEL